MFAVLGYVFPSSGQLDKHLFNSGCVRFVLSQPGSKAGGDAALAPRESCPGGFVVIEDFSAAELAKTQN